MIPCFWNEVLKISSAFKNTGNSKSKDFFVCLFLPSSMWNDLNSFSSCVFTTQLSNGITVLLWNSIMVFSFLLHKLYLPSSTTTKIIGETWEFFSILFSFLVAVKHPRGVCVEGWLCLLGAVFCLEGAGTGLIFLNKPSTGLWDVFIITSLV